MASALCCVDLRKRLRSATIGDRAFFVVALRVWNTLSSNITASFLGHICCLKMHIFAMLFR